SDEKLSPAVRELSWTHNITIMSRCKTNEERLFYIDMCRRNHLTKRELQYQLQLPDKKLFENKLKEI
ncbi:MAG: hypothetical protein J6Z01_14395, partial [Bacteroidales bacterium]|nr:hypothetical protein [Bacteroidales bacterium]